MQGSGEIVISGREKLTVSGVDGIISFCETEAVLSTSLGYLAVTGSELKVDGFDRGQGNVIISSVAGTDVLAEIPAGSGPVKKGTVCKGFLL